MVFKVKELEDHVNEKEDEEALLLQELENLKQNLAVEK